MTDDFLNKTLKVEIEVRKHPINFCNFKGIILLMHDCQNDFKIKTKSTNLS